MIEELFANFWRFLMQKNQWILETFTYDDPWPWIYLCVPLWSLAIYLRLYHAPKRVPMDVMALRSKYLSLQQPIPRSQEKLIPIAEMYIYPVRGVRAGAEVDSLELGMHGAKYDIEILLAAKDDKAIVTTNKYHVMGCLR